jgi:predicted dehydrogenase
VLIGAVHEIDPTQIFWEQAAERWDTAPFPRENEKYDVYFIASYNHTHAPIALHALEQGAHVVMEKPIASNYAELDRLIEALKRGRSQIFIGFQKRYSDFNDLARRDLNVQPGDPISYHCIVHEIIQPEFFWYNWPVSGSRLFSNGCHHVDHFLYLNEWSEPSSIDLTLAGDGTINVCMELENGAFFTMVFSEKGSSRVGPRDHIELKTTGRNVKTTDATRYFSEHEREIIRERRVYKTESYRKMYQTIGRKIARDEPGDSLRSVAVSARTMLVLEDKLQEALKKKTQAGL